MQASCNEALDTVPGSDLHGFAGIMRRKRGNLTKPDVAAAAVPDLVRRDFTSPMPGLKLIGGISCFPANEGWLYVATVLDLYSK